MYQHFLKMQFSGLEIAMYHRKRVNFLYLICPVSSVAVEQTLTCLRTGVTFPQAGPSAQSVMFLQSQHTKMLNYYSAVFPLMIQDAFRAGSNQPVSVAGCRGHSEPPWFLREELGVWNCCTSSKSGFTEPSDLCMMLRVAQVLEKSVYGSCGKYGLISILNLEVKRLPEYPYKFRISFRTLLKSQLRKWSL